MLLMIDNYDSFTYNLVHYFIELDVFVKTYRNDQITLEEIEMLAPNYIVISPGPGNPDQAGISLAVIQRFAGIVPILGVCLGHQAIGQFFGGKISHAKEIMHGKISCVYHNNQGIFSGLPQAFQATRYHSLVIERDTLPDCLEPTAWVETAKGEIAEIMGVRHRCLPLEGVQFHPESILTEHGHAILKNFLQRYQ